VDKIRLSKELKEDIKHFIIKILNENKESGHKKLVNLSIRISHKDIKLKYALILQDNVNYVSLDPNNITNLFFIRLNKRNIDINHLTSIHIHLYFS